MMNQRPHETAPSAPPKPHSSQDPAFVPRRKPRRKQAKPWVSIGVPSGWLVWLASHIRAIFLDALMLAGIALFAWLGFLIDFKVGVAVLAATFVLLSIVLATIGGADNGDA